MDATTLKALLHDLAQYAAQHENSVLLTAILAGAETAGDKIIDDFFATPKGKTYQKKP
jgi:hypothetical protein